MKIPKHFAPGAAALLLAAFLAGCAKASPDTTGYATIDSTVVNASFEETWDAVKDVLREQDYLIYTRDKRGYFLAYADIERRRFVPTVPSRTQLSITLDPVSSNATRITVETSYQRYGVTLLTYPGWLDRPTEDNSDAIRILESIQAKISGEPPSMTAANPSDQTT